MSRWRTAVLVCLAAVLLVGCWSRKEVEDLAVITAAALDRLPDGAVRWTIEVPRPQAAAAVEGGGRGLVALTFSAEGPDPMASELRLARVVDRELFWAHANYFLLGEGFARAGIGAFLDFATRRYQVRQASALFLTRGEAGPLLSSLVSPFDETVHGALRNFTQLTRVEALPLFDINTLLRRLHQPGVDPAVPVLSWADQDGPLELEMGVLVGDRLVAIFSGDAAWGLLWMLERQGPRVLNLPCPKSEPGTGVVSVRVLQTDTDVTPALDAGRVAVAVDVRVEGQLLHWSCPEPADVRGVRALEEALAQQIAAHVLRGGDVIRSHRVDPVGFGMELFRREPAQWRRVEGAWRDLLTKVRIEPRVRATIAETGLRSDLP